MHMSEAVSERRGREERGRTVAFVRRYPLDCSFSGGSEDKEWDTGIRVPFQLGLHRGARRCQKSQLKRSHPRRDGSAAGNAQPPHIALAPSSPRPGSVLSS